MPEVIILQRLVPSYRIALFRRVWEELGWPVVFGRNLGKSGMKLLDNEPFMLGYDFHTSRRGITHVPVARILADLKPSAVIAEGALSMTSTWNLLARRNLFGGPKVFFWSIGYNTQRQLDPGRWNGRQELYPSAYRLGDGCMTYGDDGRGFLQPRLGGKPVFVAHNSLDMEEIAAARVKARVLPRRGFPELVCVSRLTPEKEFVKLVDAFRIVLKSMPDAKLTIVGDGPERPAIMAAAGDELERSIFMAGAVYDELTVASHMNRADAFVIAGRVGLAINHALGYGLPVFCFRRSAEGPLHGSEITHLKVGKTGYFAEPYEARAMADTLAKVFLKIPDLKQHHEPMIKAYVESHISIARMFEGFKALSAHLAAQWPSQYAAAQAP